VRNANRSTMVMPGSLALRFVHSGVWTGMRALASVTSWSKDRSSSTGTGIVTVASYLPALIVICNRSCTPVAMRV
jgi:hypothetical protein